MSGKPKCAGLKPLGRAGRDCARGGPWRVRSPTLASGARPAGSPPGPASARPRAPGGKRLAHAQIGAPGSPGWGRGGGVSKKELDPLAAEAMAAPSPPSPAPPPPARLSGTRSSRAGRGAAAHAVSSEASGLGGAAREGVVDRGDTPWPGGEGSGGQRGPGGLAPAPAPLLSAPTGSERPEGISVEEVMVTRMQLLEDELSSLKEELALCQVSRPPLRAGACGEARPAASAVGCVAARVGDPARPARGAPSRSPPPDRGLPPRPAPPRPGRPPH